ncbi:MAG: hypothetical protein U0527_04430 [Candidatus Eisenbacteria bacterium]
MRGTDPDSPFGPEHDMPPGSEVLATGDGPATETFPGHELWSAEELSALHDGNPFRLRARVVARMRLVFEGLRHRMARHVAAGHYLGPAGCDWQGGKIGRGEYLGDMPYVYLDLPRYFDAESAFTFRTLFWWGHGVSFSLILGGPHLAEYRQRLLRHADVLSALDVHVAMGETPWDWERGAGHTLKIEAGREPELARLLRGQNYLKCVRFLDFDEADFRRCRIDDAALLTFQALEPLILA